VEPVEYVAQYFRFNYVSGNRQIKISGHCPFCMTARHDLRLYMNAVTGIGFCHHCQRGFDFPSFVAANEGIKKHEARKIAAGDGYAIEARQEEIKLEWPQMAQPTGRAKAYLDQRGISEALISHFRLCEAKSNVTIAGREYRTTGRILIPIYDENGQPVSWQARTAGSDSPKYLFPPGFRGADVLYNAHGIPQRPDYLILSEGVMDVFGWWRSGAKNTVATFGKSLTAAQERILKQTNPKAVFVAWDTDATGHSYTVAERLSDRFDVRLVDMQGRDADELSAGELAARLTQAKPYSWSDKIRYGLGI